jgi:hypothetical protein
MGDVIPKLLWQQPDKEGHHTSGPTGPVCVEGRAAFIAKKDKDAFMLKGEDCLSEELLVAGRDTCRVRADQPPVNPVFSDESPVSAAYMVKVAHLQILARVPSVTIARREH